MTPALPSARSHFTGGWPLSLSGVDTATSFVAVSRASWRRLHGIWGQSVNTNWVPGCAGPVVEADSR